MFNKLGGQINMKFHNFIIITDNDISILLI